MMNPGEMARPEVVSNSTCDEPVTTPEFPHDVV